MKYKKSTATAVEFEWTCCCIWMQLLLHSSATHLSIRVQENCNTSRVLMQNLNIRLQLLLNLNAPVVAFECTWGCIWVQLLLHSSAPVVAFECNCCCIRVHLLLHSSATAVAFECTCCCIQVQLLLHSNALLHSLCATLSLSVSLLLCLCLPLIFSASVKPLNTLPLSAVNVHLPLHYWSYASTLYCCTCF